MRFIRIAVAATLIALLTSCASLPAGHNIEVVGTFPAGTPTAFRSYFRRLTRNVDTEWRRELEQLERFPPPGSKVVIRFELNSDGLVERIDDVDDAAGKEATYACVNAVTGAQPFRPWKDDMIAALGHEQALTFTFYYK